jgi:hypothetical protein
MKSQDFGALLNLVIKSFSKIKISEPYNCKTYSISPCGYENLVKITINPKIVIEIILEGDYITSVYIIRTSFFKKRTLLKWFAIEEDSKKFNTDTLEIKFEKIAEEVE